MYLVVGLGNPGEEYEKSRHNVGFILLDSIVSGVWEKSSKANTFYFKGEIKNEEVEYLKPQTFMNESGFSVAYAEKKHSILPEHIIVIHDDIDLPLGTIRISFDRGDGGHNGIKSIFQHLGSREFVRVRVGISIIDETGVLRKPDVLGNFSKSDLEKLKTDIAPKVSSILESIIVDGREKAMTLYN